VQQPAPVATASQTTATTPTGSDTTDATTPTDGGVQTVSNVTPRRSRAGSRVASEDHSLRPAGVIYQSDQAYVNAPSKPVEFALEDARGTKRKISLPPVSFGSQSLVNNRVPVSYTGNSRVW
ncbi:MAG TPA: hypothetical protein VIT19_09525, partial [Pyrinomonadaceae bacterium]